ncbi:uncharacterized protein MELLADRAFT_102375 [Melampsora larici-populina 98AG31]|uniref:Uncharacterized protein n=1 Tax=Melampsora larici-populina (strain 98AG31 / pathotype 3-4-7) TaxID=747676 RepID=F4R832_MELLP|nr:uncharacterized protein MELLADRAFT_102375 [Melampsora larici-populina 98AG31]EGG11687.1 hypothetical protein MELLADRAFT_102375 [Melampsora larici-populina 98AG31]
MHHTGHPTSCLNCVAISAPCTWGIVDCQLLRDQYQCDRCDQNEIHCEWTTFTPPPEIPSELKSNSYGHPPETKTEAERHLRIKTWVCKPDKPSDPKLRARWMANVRIWNNGGNAPLPPQHTTSVPPQATTSLIPTRIKTPPLATQPESIHTPNNTPPPSQSPTHLQNTINDPTSPPAISVNFNQSPPKAPRNFIHKTKTKNKKPKLQKSFQHKKFFNQKSTPIIIPNSPIKDKTNLTTTVEDLIETPPPSPVLDANNQHATRSINPEDVISEIDDPRLSTSNLNEQTPNNSYPSTQGIDAFDAEYGAGCAALTETIFNMLSTHWRIFTSNDPVETTARINLVKAFKNIVALDIVYRAHPRPDLRPPHYDGITTGFPPHFPIPPTGHENFYDGIAEDNLKHSTEGKGKKRAHE